MRPFAVTEETPSGNRALDPARGFITYDGHVL
jgi:hypothetical protein